MKIAISNSESFFALFYILSFTVTYLLFIVISIRQKIPLWSVLLMLTAGSLFTILGSRLITIPFMEWGNLIQTGDSGDYAGRSAVGGLFFGLVAVIITQRILGLGKPVLDMYSWIAPVGFGIQKIGCLLNGCCYGKPTDLPWGIQYSIGSNAHFNHWVKGLIDENAGYSLRIHPVQFYEVICLFGLAYIVWRTVKVWKKSGSSLFFSLFIYLIFRFFIEFLRDASSSGFNNNLVLGVRVFQWFLLISGIISGIALLINERYTFSCLNENTCIKPSKVNSFLFIAVISVLVYIFRGLFTPFELVSIDTKFIPAILITGYYAFKSITIVRLRLAATSFLVLPLFLIAQTFPPDSVKSASVRNFYENYISSYKRIDAGISSGDYYNTVRYNPQAAFCGSSYTNEDYKYVYRLGGAGYSVITKNRNAITTKGINLYGGTEREDNLTRIMGKTNFIFGVNPYIRYDLKWIGGGIGVHMGNLRWVPGNPVDEITFNRGTRYSPIMPEAYFRVGRRDILDLKYTYGFNFPTSFPVLLHEISIGSGFGHETEYSLRFGIDVSKNEGFTFLSGEGLINKKIGLTLKYNFGNGDFFDSSLNEVETRKGRILFGANWRFGFKK
jgi:prolipoprotein diacylglyceryltransferase